MYHLFIRWLQRTAWPMTPPKPYLFVCLAAVAAAVSAFLAWHLRHRSEAFRVRLLFLCGLILAAAELYKQLFLYYIVNGGRYDWWYFPFQLCSLPLYLCLLLPFVPAAVRRILCTFMYSYNLLGAAMAFVDPSGLLHPYWTLTLHGFFWHILLIFIGLLIAFSRMADPSARGFLAASACFAAACVLATAVNVLAHPLGNPDMFYISPYILTTQPVFSQIAARLGIPAGNLIYLLSIAAGAAMLHLLYARVSGRQS